MFRATSSVYNHNKGTSGRPRATRINANVERVFEKVLNSRTKAHRRISRELGISRSSMVQDTAPYSYRIQVIHELKEDDFQGRLRYCGRILANIYQDPDYLQN
jgi:hypothetical protein